MEISVIASGSNGNCCLVEEKDVSILIDAGKSCREIEKRMNSMGKSLENVNALLITHSHYDHCSSVGIVSKRYGLPIYLMKDVHSLIDDKVSEAEKRFISPGKSFTVKGVEIRPVATSHNVPSCGFVIGGFGLFTDTGIVTREMEAMFPKLRCALLESNHDIDMLINGAYPAFLKQLILSDRGHLSNVHASKFIQEKGQNLSHVLLGHLSGNNNTPKAARAAFETLVKRKIDCHICSRESISGSWVI
ncbi:hypothetical protein COV19_00205 [Candidatus Woesearchaeota archaeon CG10_big_fil_rev_8_21_14_0_10_44_13]|nr:MAG: hypothetical protein COV19_00205 [Candidatus Woesearchaeota archaeon CG10_big_fil_rev_8_21_14_0_10_44_13]